MSRRGLHSRGRGTWQVIVPAWRTEDPELDTFDKVIAIWLFSHLEGYVDDHVSMTSMARKLGISTERTRKSLARLHELGIIFSLDVKPGARAVIGLDKEVWEHGNRAESRTPPPSEIPHGTERNSARSEAAHLPMGEDQAGTQVARATAARADALFERFWQAYPRKIGKPAAKAKFVAALRTARVEDIAAGLHRWCEHWAARGEPEFIPHPSTWLHQQRWNDTPPPVRGQRGAPTRPLTRMEQAYQRRTNCTDDEARAWSQHASELRRGEVIASDVVAEAAGG